MAAVKLTHLLIFTQQFGSMIRSNLPLVDVLENLARETPQKKLRLIIQDISDRVQHGADLGDALAAHQNVFSDIYVNVIRAGMASGRLAEAISQITVYLNVISEATRKVRTALSYPIFMLAAFFLVFNGMVFFILPRFAKMFHSFGKELPWATEILMSLGRIWAESWYLMIGGTAIAAISFAIWVMTEDGRMIWDRVKISIPIIGPVWRMAALSRFIRTLAVQMKNEVLLLDGLVLSAEAAGNVYIRESLYDIADDIEKGAGLSDAFRRHDVFQGIVLQMISAGEEAGKLDELLLASADYFDSLLNDRLENITGLINPILTVVVGLAIAGMMIASFLPVFEIGSAIN
jgi:MSHA biogenesis protein MshG